jgi:uncharacterized protein (DUF58 family)
VARTDRLYTKQFRETTNVAAMLVVDTSGSMAFPDGASSKFRYAIVAAAALAHLISNQGDTIGLTAETQFLPPKAGRQHLRRLLSALSAMTAQQQWRSAAVIRRASERLGRRGLLLVWSDFYDDEEATFAELRRAARLGHEVIVFQVISRQEIEFSYRSDLEFVDLENGRRLAVDVRAARRRYLDGITGFLEQCRRRAGAEGFQYSLMVTDTPHEHSLRSFLLARR